MFEFSVALYERLYGISIEIRLLQGSLMIVQRAGERVRRDRAKIADQDLEKHESGYLH